MNKVVLISGGAKGIGKAIALELGKQGYDIVINYLTSESEAHKLKDDIIKNYGVRCLAIQADVSKEDEVDKMVSLIESELGGVDILINNAGKQGVKKDIGHMQVEEMMPYLNVNVRGPWLCIHHAAAELIKTKGKIVNISSIAALQGSYGGTAYGVSKGAVLSLTYAVANELGLYGVRCNSVLPYSAATEETLRLLGEEFHEMRKSGNPLHQLCTADDVAYACLFLASDESRSCTGLNLLCDCGAHVRSCPFDLEEFKKNNVYEGAVPLY